MPIIADHTRRKPSRSEQYLRERQAARTTPDKRPTTKSQPPNRTPPPSRTPPTPPRKKPRANQRKYLKWAFWILIAVALYFSFGWLKAQLFLLLQQNETLWSLYLTVAAEIESRSLLGLFYAAFFGALFFIALPVEVIFLYYLGLNYYFVQVLTITLVGNLLGILLDYFFGWLVGPKVLQWFMKAETYRKFQKKIAKAGAFIVIVGNIIPFPIEPFTVFLGAVRYGVIRLLIYTFIGKLAKFGLLWLGYKYFTLYVSPYISVVNAAWFLNLIKSSFGGG